MGVIVEIRDPREDLEEKIAAYKWRKRRNILLTVVTLLAAVASTYLLVEMQTYTNMRTIESYAGKGTDKSSYLQFADGVLKYSRDGISYLNKKGEEQWNQAYQIKNPFLNTSKKAVAVAARGGNDIYVLDEKGLKGEIHTNYPIENMVVAENGIVSALLKNESSPLVVCYDAAGNILAEHRASMSGTGYPIAMALSPQGTKLQISYLCVEDGVQATRVTYFDFGESNGDEKEYQTAEEIYKNMVIPVSFFVNDKTSVLVGDRCFMIYKETNQRPEAAKTIELDKEIKSVFYDEEYLGFILNDSDEGYEMRLYDMEGKEKLSRAFTGEYTNVKVSRGNVFLYNGKKCRIYSELGVKKFDGEADQDILEILPLTGINKYLVMNADGMDEIRLVK